MFEKEIVELKRLRNSILLEVSSFPETSRDEIIFGEWNIKDLIAHLNNWMVHDTDCLVSLIDQKLPVWEPNVDDFNKRGVKLRQHYSWSELITEFNNLSDTLLEIYKNLPIKLQNSRIWPDIDETPDKFIQEEIKHWSLELENIKSKQYIYG